MYQRYQPTNSEYQSGMEALGAASAVAQLLSTAIGIVSHFRNAHERQKGLANVLDAHWHELRRTRDIIKVIVDEEALRTAAVSAKLDELHDVAKRLVSYLQGMGKHRSPFRQFTYQLFSGSKEESALASIMESLSRAKTNLHLHLQVANVGLTRNLGNTVVFNTEIIDRIDHILQRTLGEGQGLKITKLVRERLPEDNAMVEINNSDLARLNSEMTSTVSNTQSATKSPKSPSLSQIILDNVTLEQALQINGSVGGKIWQNIRIEIRGNKASGQSTQVNHTISDEAFDRMVAARAVNGSYQIMYIITSTIGILLALFGPTSILSK